LRNDLRFIIEDYRSKGGGGEKNKHKNQKNRTKKYQNNKITNKHKNRKLIKNTQKLKK
jgi:hypothetical protein